MRVYVEIDSQTHFITELLLPKEVEVNSLRYISTGEIEVVFKNTAIIYYIRDDNPDFSVIFKTLQTAQKKNNPVFITDSDIDHEIIYVKPIPNFSPSPVLHFSSSPPSPSPPLKTLIPTPPTEVSEQRAKELFDLVSSHSCNPITASSPCIPFLYPDDGSWVRAELMCNLLIKEPVHQGSDIKVEPEKIWIEGKLHDVKSVNNPCCEVSWAWNVAPTLLVATPKGSERRVLDPCLFPKGPVAPEEWRKAHRYSKAKLTYTPRTRYNHWDNTVATQAIADSDMEYYRDALKKRAAKYGPPPYKCYSLNGKWAYGHKIAVSDSTSKTPVACMFQNKLYLFWKARDPKNNIYFSDSEYGINWPNARKINNIDLTPESPTACVFNDKLYIFWKATDFENSIYYSVSEDGTNWPYGIKINNVDSTPESPTSCVFNNKLYIFWKSNDLENSIYYSASGDGTNWSRGRKINDIDSTPKALTACVFNNKLYIFWKANDIGNSIYYSASENGINWPNGRNINDIDSTPEALTACVSDNKLHLFWKSNDSGNRIYNSSSTDGISWPAAHRINDFDKTPQAPDACVFNHQLYLFWKSNDSGNRIYCSINYRRHHSEEIKFEYECLIDEVEE